MDLGYQKAAQAILDRDPTDPFDLDPSGDGIACSSLPSRATRLPNAIELPATGSGPSSWSRSRQATGNDGQPESHGGCVVPTAARDLQSRAT